MAARLAVAPVKTATTMAAEALLTAQEAGAMQVGESWGGPSFPSRDIGIVSVAVWVVSSALSCLGAAQGRLVG